MISRNFLSHANHSLQHQLSKLWTTESTCQKIEMCKCRLTKLEFDRTCGPSGRSGLAAAVLLHVASVEGKALSNSAVHKWQTHIDFQITQIVIPAGQHRPFNPLRVDHTDQLECINWFDGWGLVPDRSRSKFDKTKILKS